MAGATAAATLAPPPRLPCCPGCRPAAARLSPSRCCWRRSAYCCWHAAATLPGRPAIDWPIRRSRHTRARFPKGGQRAGPASRQRAPWRDARRPRRLLPLLRRAQPSRALLHKVGHPLLVLVPRWRVRVLRAALLRPLVRLPRLLPRLEEARQLDGWQRLLLRLSTLLGSGRLQRLVLAGRPLCRHLAATAGRTWGADGKLTSRHSLIIVICLTAAESGRHQGTGCCKHHSAIVCSKMQRRSPMAAHPSVSVSRSAPSAPCVTYPYRPWRCCACCQASCRGGQASGASPSTSTTRSCGAPSSSLATQSAARQGGREGGGVQSGGQGTG